MEPVLRKFFGRRTSAEVAQLQNFLATLPCFEQLSAAALTELATNVGAWMPWRVIASRFLRSCSRWQGSGAADWLGGLVGASGTM